MNAPGFENNQLTPISDKGSFHDTIRKNSIDLNKDNVKENVDDCEIVPPPTDMGGIRELAVNTISNIVAFGTVFDDEDMTKTIHGVPLKEGCLRVSVDGEIQGDPPLPFPVLGEMELVREAIGSQVTWSEELVIRKQPTKNKKKKCAIVKSLFDKAELHPFVPKRCKLLYKHAKTIMQETNEERDELDTFAFIDPAATYKCERSGFHPYLVERLKEGKTDRIFFMPYNPREHWILKIIWEDEIYMLDPLPKLVHYQSWENSVINAVKTFNAEMGRVNKVPKVKLLSVELSVASYYVMRYMKDIINDDILSFSTKWATKSRIQYIQEQLDKVRIDAADYLQTLL